MSHHLLKLFPMSHRKACGSMLPLRNSNEAKRKTNTSNRLDVPPIACHLANGCWCLTAISQEVCCWQTALVRAAHTLHHWKASRDHRFKCQHWPAQRLMPKTCRSRACWQRLPWHILNNAHPLSACGLLADVHHDWDVCAHGAFKDAPLLIGQHCLQVGFVGWAD